MMLSQFQQHRFFTLNKKQHCQEHHNSLLFHSHIKYMTTHICVDEAQSFAFGPTQYIIVLSPRGSKPGRLILYYVDIANKSCAGFT